MAEVKRDDNTDKPVCVTGASGFIGTHVTRELAERGYRVRATVRDADNQEKVAHLHKLSEGAKHSIEVFSADLMDEGSFDEPFAGCDFICHVAASVRLTADDPQRDIVDPAVLGTKNALASAVKAGSVKRFVLTSSVSAIFSTARRPDHVYTEQDWCQDASLDKSPYPLAKTKSERAAWDFIDQQSPGFDLVAINPAYVIGPVYTETHLRSSPGIVRDLLTGTFPMCPQLSFGVVDVREVADAHANALEISAASGRYMLVHERLWVQDMAKALRERFPDNKKIPKRRMPNFMMYIAAMFDKRISFSFLRRNLGATSKFDSAKSVDELAIEYRSAAQSVVDAGTSMIERSLL